MAAINAKVCFAWDADTCEWATLTVDVTTTQTWIVSDEPVIDTTIDDAYVTTRTGTSTQTYQYIYTREDPAFDDFLQSVNSFAVVRGVEMDFDTASISMTLVGEPSEFGPGRARSVYCHVAGENSFGDNIIGPYVYFSDEDPYTIDWTITYVKVGPDTGAPIPADESGTISGNLLTEVYLVQIADEMRWDVSALVISDAVPSYHATWPDPIIAGGQSADIKVFVHNLKTDPGDSVDFGDAVDWETPFTDQPVITGASTTITSDVVTCDDTSNLLAGMYVWGTNIPVGTYITNILSGTSFDMTSAATGTTSGLTLYTGVWKVTTWTFTGEVVTTCS